METPRISLAYAAGFIDGDGSVLVSKSGNNHNVSVYATNSHREALEPFSATFGGSVRTLRVDQRNAKWRQMQTWGKHIPSSGAFLRQLEPFLFLKKPQARLCLQLVARKREERRTFLGWRYGSIGLNAEELCIREELYRQVQHLNAKPCTCPHDGVPTLEYLAGFFDAEGCVGIYKYKKNAHQIMVNVSNRCRWICEQFMALFGGSVGRGHGAYQWQAKCRIAERFLLAITPHLVLKKQRAENALSLYDHVGVNNGWGFIRSEHSREAVLVTKTMSDRLNMKGCG